LARGIRGSEKAPPPGPGDWTLGVFLRSDGSIPFESFYEKLDPYSQAVLTSAIEIVLKAQGHNVCNSHWGKPLKKGLYEFRVGQSLAAICKIANIDPPGDFNADKQLLIRVFFAVEGDRVILLLGGYDKAEDPSDKRHASEIEFARKLLQEHMEEERRDRKRRG
jgi:hypothetical protein